MGDFKKWEDPSNGGWFWNEGLIPLHDYGNNKLIDKKEKEKVDQLFFVKNEVEQNVLRLLNS